jgi:hypothetical protein
MDEVGVIGTLRQLLHCVLYTNCHTREVFMSTNEVLQDAEVIKGRCTVLYKKEFDDDYADSLPSDTYVYRYCYDPSKRYIGS